MISLTRLAPFALCVACSTTVATSMNSSDVAPDAAPDVAPDATPDVVDAARDDGTPTDLTPDRPMPPREGDPCAAVVDLNARGTRRGDGLSLLADGTSAPERTLGELPACGTWRPSLAFVTAFRYTARTTAVVHFAVADRSVGQPLTLTVLLADACSPDARVVSCFLASLETRLLEAQTEAPVPAGTSVYLLVGTRLPVPVHVDAAGRYELNVRELPARALREPCGLGEAACVEGAACNGYLRGSCVRAGDLQGACLPGRRCAEGLVCDLNACVRALFPGDPCGTEQPYGRCPEGTVCESDGTSYRCRPHGTRGGACRAAAPRCDAGLSCVFLRCLPTQAEGEACDAQRFCAEGLSCAVPQGATAGVCVRMGTRGAQCRAQAPRCDEGLACASEFVSPTVCLPAVAAGAECDSSRGVSACAEGICFNGLCRVAGTNGGLCRPSVNPCDPGLGCIGQPLQCRPVVSGTANCDRNACAPGATCVSLDTSSAMRCVSDGANGGRCRRSAPACDEGLACTRTVGGSELRCRPSVPFGARCDLNGTRSACAAGSVCADDAICRQPGEPGSACADASPACGEGLQCVGRSLGYTGRCMRTLARGATCSPFSELCPSGQTCAQTLVTVCADDGTSRDTRCRAGASPCDPGLVCHPFTARCVREAAVGEGCSVGEGYDFCVEGASCIAQPGGFGRCVRDGVAGGRCRVTGAACDAGLRCTGAARMQNARCE